VPCRKADYPVHVRDVGMACRTRSCGYMNWKHSVSDTRKDRRGKCSALHSTVSAATAESRRLEGPIAIILGFCLNVVVLEMFMSN